MRPLCKKKKFKVLCQQQTQVKWCNGNLLNKSPQPQALEKKDTTGWVIPTFFRFFSRKNSQITVVQLYWNNLQLKGFYHNKWHASSLKAACTPTNTVDGEWSITAVKKLHIRQDSRWFRWLTERATFISCCFLCGAAWSHRQQKYKPKVSGREAETY